MHYTFSASWNIISTMGSGVIIILLFTIKYLKNIYALENFLENLCF